MRKIDKERKTKETEIKVSLNIDGQGESEIKTGIDFLDHMLTLFAFHGLFDLKIQASGDTKVDSHHTNEDIGIVLGQAFKDSLGNKNDIKRFGFAYVPMGRALARAVVDISGRGELHFSWIPPDGLTWDTMGLDLDLQESGVTYGLLELQSFLEAFAKNSGITINIGLLQEENTHHQLEAIFKALGLALDQATQIDSRRKGIPSAKGRID